MCQNSSKSNAEPGKSAGQQKAKLCVRLAYKLGGRASMDIGAEERGTVKTASVALCRLAYTKIAQDSSVDAENVRSSRNNWRW